MRQDSTEKFGVVTPLPPAAPAASRDRIRVAYLSADFHEHAVAYLVAELFERHDRSKFELHAVSFGPQQKSVMRGDGSNGRSTIGMSCAT